MNKEEIVVNKQHEYGFKLKAMHKINTAFNQIGMS